MFTPKACPHCDPWGALPACVVLKTQGPRIHILKPLRKTSRPLYHLRAMGGFALQRRRTAGYSTGSLSPHSSRGCFAGQQHALCHRLHAKPLPPRCAVSCPGTTLFTVSVFIVPPGRPFNDIKQADAACPTALQNLRLSTKAGP